TAEAAFLVAEGERGIVQEDVPVALEPGDARVDGEAVPARAGEFAAIRPRTLDRGRGGVGDAFVGMRVAVERGVGQVVQVAALVQPGPFLEVGWGDLGDRAVDLDHVRLEPRDVGLAVAPGQPGAAVVVGEDGRVDVLPAVGAPGRHLAGDQGRTFRIDEGAGGRTGNGHADGLARVRVVVLDRGVEPEPA